MLDLAEGSIKPLVELLPETLNQPFSTIESHQKTQLRIFFPIVEQQPHNNTPASSPDYRPFPNSPEPEAGPSGVRTNDDNDSGKKKKFFSLTFLC